MIDRVRKALCCPNAPHTALGLCSRHYQQHKAWSRGVVPTDMQLVARIAAVVAAEKLAKAERSASKAEARRVRANQKRTVKGGYRKYTTKYRYGVDQEYIDALAKEQGGVCAICSVGGMLYIDHCHTNGNVRGLLCPSCNTMVGVIENKGHLFSAARVYLSSASVAYEERKAGNDDRPKV